MRWTHRFCMAPLWTARWSEVPRPFLQRPNLCQCPGNHVNIPRVKHRHSFFHLPMHPNAGFPCMHAFFDLRFFGLFLFFRSLSSFCEIRTWLGLLSFLSKESHLTSCPPQNLPQNLAQYLCRPFPTHLEPSQEPSQNLSATHPKP